jgi:hypothetical protein
MTTFTIHIERTSKIVVDVEAQDADGAVRLAWDVMTDRDIHDSDDRVEFVSDEYGNSYEENRRGEWKLKAKAREGRG